jgi:hypothetical protein
MYLEGSHIYILKHNNVFLVINRCILKDTKVFASFFNFLGVFIVYFIVLVVYSNVIQCTYNTFQCILMYMKVFECI